MITYETSFGTSHDLLQSILLLSIEASDARREQITICLWGERKRERERERED